MPIPIHIENAALCVFFACCYTTQRLIHTQFSTHTVGMYGKMASKNARFVCMLCMGTSLVQEWVNLKIVYTHTQFLCIYELEKELFACK